MYKNPTNCVLYFDAEEYVRGAFEDKCIFLTFYSIFIKDLLLATRYNRDSNECLTIYAFHEELE